MGRPRAPRHAGSGYLTGGGELPAAVGRACRGRVLPHRVPPAGGDVLERAGLASTALPGTATAILGIGDYPAEGQPQRLFLADGPALELDASGAVGRVWTTTMLPDTAATFADTVMLYAATPADYAAALSAASAAGLPAAQVTRSFSTAWSGTLSGDYLVIAVSEPANDALHFNACGWANPSGASPGSTPFHIAAAPLEQLPEADAYENAAAGSAPQSRKRAAGLAYYAAHGQLPAGVKALPAAATPAFACSGEPSCYPAGIEVRCRTASSCAARRADLVA